MDKYLLEYCLGQKEQSISYRRKTNDDYLLSTHDNYFWTTVRTNPVAPDFVSSYLLNINELFRQMLFRASSIKQDIYVLSKESTDFGKLLDAMTTEMGRWDTIPKCLIVSKKFQFFQDKQEIDVHMRGCTNNDIINTVLTGTFTIPIIRSSLRTIKDQNEYGFLLSNSCGFFYKQGKEIQILIRPVGCFRFEIDRFTDKEKKAMFLRGIKRRK